MNLDKALLLIKRFEGCRLKAYADLIGIITIGFGHTSKELTLNDEITQEEAEALLLQDCEKTAALVEQEILGHNLNENQFNAIVSLVYNIGIGHFRTSTMLKMIKAQDATVLIAGQFLRWNKAGGSEVPGLTNRRNAEMQLFIS